MSTESDIDLGFYYEFEHGVDDKRRVQTPIRWKPSLTADHYVFVLWPHFDLDVQFIRVLPLAKHKELMQEVKRTPFGDPRGDSLRRNLGRTSDIVTMDSSRRFMLPKGMGEAAGITDKVMLVGAWDTFELWGPKEYQAMLKYERQHAREAYGSLSQGVAK